MNYWKIYQLTFGAVSSHSSESSHSSDSSQSSESSKKAPSYVVPSDSLDLDLEPELELARTAGPRDIKQITQSTAWTNRNFERSLPGYHLLNLTKRVVSFERPLTYSDYPKLVNIGHRSVVQVWLNISSHKYLHAKVAVSTKLRGWWYFSKPEVSRFWAIYPANT